MSAARALALDRLGRRDPEASPRGEIPAGCEAVRGALVAHARSPLSALVVCRVLAHLEECERCARAADTIAEAFWL